MAVDKFEAPYALVFNLDQYAGNYEREFCAFVIGATGECGVGEYLAAEYREDHPQGTKFWNLSDRCSHQPDDNGCYRPVSIYHDPEFDSEMARYHSVIIFLSSVPEDDEFELILSRAKEFCAWQSYKGQKKPLNLRGAKLISNKVERIIKTQRTFDIS